MSVSEERENDNAITGYWSVPETVGGCSNCHQRLMRVAQIKFNSTSFRLCDDCANAMRDLLESMLDD